MKIKPKWKIRKQKPLPLTHDCDQIIVIKPLNHRKQEEHERDVQVAISPSFLYQFLTSNPPWMRKWERKRIESRDSRGEVSKQINCFDFQLECLQSSKNMSFYSVFGRNRLIVSIDGYDGTVHHGPFRLSRGRSILMNGLDDPA